MSLPSAKAPQSPHHPSSELAEPPVAPRRGATALHTLLTLLFAAFLAVASLGLSACGGSAQASEEQADCYGDDLPVSLDS